MPNNNLCLVTGGAGYFGSQLVNQLVEEQKYVRVLDLNLPSTPVPGVEYIQGDISDFEICLRATDKVEIVFHNIAQVPLAKNKRQFYKVNIVGTQNICEASKINSVKKFVYTSSSAVYGIPLKLPVEIGDPMIPVEAYGQAKLEGEKIVKELSNFGVEVKIVRPRTILGLGRLGIFGILFRWVQLGLNIFILGRGDEPYQFVHAKDLAKGIIQSSHLSGYGEYNLGALHFGTFREDLQGLCDYAGSGAKVVSLNERLIRLTLRIANTLKLLPLASYQIQLYSKAMYFDSYKSWRELGYFPTYSNLDMMKESYDSFNSRLIDLNTENLSHHQKTLRSFSLNIVTCILLVFTKTQKRFSHK
jgi:nucleoside-diphosphate-sugar epimerase